MKLVIIKTKFKEIKTLFPFLFILLLITSCNKDDSKLNEVKEENNLEKTAFTPEETTLNNSFKYTDSELKNISAIIFDKKENRNKLKNINSIGISNYQNNLKKEVSYNNIQLVKEENSKIISYVRNKEDGRAILLSNDKRFPLILAYIDKTTEKNLFF